ncbi:MAG: hypothetical protein PHE27_07310 [Alphaproteobacteria bacterium]|nr:hypothetical protein [Alphaproteobacteria bacterium]
MPSVALVSGADRNYFPLLIEWVHSIRRFEESADMDICIIDAGLTSEQVNALKPLVKTIFSPEWPEGIPAKKVRGNDCYKANICRPFIRDLFPGYDVYMWMDADTWVQTWGGVQMHIDAALRHPDRLVGTNGSDRNQPKQFRVKWIWRWPYRVTNFYFSNGRKAFDFATAKKLCAQSVICAGCFALSAKAPHWEVWQKKIVAATVKGKLFTADRLTMGMAVYLDGLKAEMLPAYTHWSCNLPPLWDANACLFVEPSMPHVPLGTMHMHGIDEMRASRKVKQTYDTLDGGKIELSMRYPHYDGGDMVTGKIKRK